jgi:hypothetical protein
MSDQEFIGETEARLREVRIGRLQQFPTRRIFGGRQPREVRELRVVSSQPVKTLCMV